ncbi:MAG TPA: hypothetical protein VNB06_13970, partial [Thermoanaerobaculia bacterium]|nr:hypothetical protein [Thermoanaerobaculia bacterium]
MLRLATVPSRTTHRLVAVWSILVLLCVSCAETPPTAEPAVAVGAEVSAVANEMWAHALERSPLLRLREGLPIERL